MNSITSIVSTIKRDSLMLYLFILDSLYQCWLLDRTIRYDPTWFFPIAIGWVLRKCYNVKDSEGGYHTLCWLWNRNVTIELMMTFFTLYWQLSSDQVAQWIVGSIFTRWWVFGSVLVKVMEIEQQHYY
jgi:hypothetical protein